MADWSYASPHLKEIKKQLALHNFDKASSLIKEIYTSEEFNAVVDTYIGDPFLCDNFKVWCFYINFKFVPLEYKEEHGEGGARGNVYTVYNDFFVAFISNNEDIFAMMLHEYFHHVLDRILWKKITNVKEQFTVKERNFIEDMYINAWIHNHSKSIADRWQLILVNHDMFHGLTFSGEEKKYNSLLTENPETCNISLNHLYENLHEENIDLLKPRHFAYFISMWHSILQDDKKIKDMINNMQINKEEDNETCTPCEAEAKQKKEQEDNQNKTKSTSTQAVTCSQN